MKKIVSIMMASILIFTLVGCANKPTPTVTPSPKDGYVNDGYTVTNGGRFFYTAGYFQMTANDTVLTITFREDEK